MKVLQVLYSGLGGHGSVVTSLINADRQRAWEHCLLFYGIEDILPAYETFCHENNIPFSFIKKQKGTFSSGWGTVCKQFKRFAPDIIILHSPVLVVPAWNYCRRRNRKLIVVEHTPHSTKGRGETITSFLSLLMARKIVCLSPEYRFGLKAKFKMLPVLSKTVVIPNGIDLENFKPSSKSFSTEIHAGMIGRFSTQKNQSMIISAIIEGFSSGKLDRNMHFHFAGNGETEELLKKRIAAESLESNVHFHGLLNEAGIKVLLSKLNMYIHASYAETMCTSVMQAMACGLPVLGSNIPGINNITEEGKNAFLFKNDDIPALVEALLQLKEEGKRKQMGEDARQYAMAHFSAEETFRKYNSLLQ